MRQSSVWSRVWPPIVPAVLVIAGMELAVRREWVRAFLIPAPSKVAATLWNDRVELWQALWETTRASAIGFALSAVGGLVIAVALSSAKWIQRAFYPYAVFFQTVPIIAIAPLLVIWLGLDQTVVASAFIVSIFPVIANTLAGLLSTDLALRDMFRLYDAGPLAKLFKLRLPFAMPNILTGLRVSAGLAVIGAIVGEFIAGGGIGGVIDIARTRQRVDKIFAGLVLASLLGVALFAAIGLLSRISLRHWHASENQE